MNPRDLHEARWKRAEREIAYLEQLYRLPSNPESNWLGLAVLVASAFIGLTLITLLGRLLGWL